MIANLCQVPREHHIFPSQQMEQFLFEPFLVAYFINPHFSGDPSFVLHDWACLLSLSEFAASGSLSPNPLDKAKMNKMNEEPFNQRDA